MDEGWISAAPQRLICGMLRQFDRLPRHIGIVMDGNRRFARLHGQARKEGHATGFATMGRLLSVVYSAGIKVVSVYAFSIENFNRTPEEVDDLMDIARERLLELVAHNGLCRKYGVRIRVLGRISMLPEDIRNLANFVMSTTCDNTQATLNLCMPYTARDDMTTAITHLASSTGSAGSAGSTSPIPHAAGRQQAIIDEDSITNAMYTKGAPPLDLLIRTSGTYRLSDFLLWETTEKTVIDFVPELWPEFTPWCLFKSILRWRWQSSIPTSSTSNAPNAAPPTTNVL